MKNKLKQHMTSNNMYNVVYVRRRRYIAGMTVTQMGAVGICDLFVHFMK